MTCKYIYNGEELSYQELLEKLHSKLLKIVDKNSLGIYLQQLKLSKVSERVFDLEIVVKGMVASALVDANLPQRYSNMKITYADKSSKLINYEGHPGYWKTQARMCLK